MNRLHIVVAAGAVLLAAGFGLRACAQAPQSSADVPRAESAPRTDDAAPAGHARAAPVVASAGSAAVPPPSGPPSAASATAGPARLAPREQVPPDAVVLDDAAGLRAWAVVERAPRGLASERGALPGRVHVHLSRPADEAIVFRVSVEPEGALRLPRGGTVRVERDRDFGAVTLAGLVAGPATVVLKPLSGASADAVLRVPVDVRAADEFPDPLVSVVVAPPDEASPGALLAGERAVRGLAGSPAASLRVLRSAFRGFASQSTDVLVAADDPAGVLGPLPSFVSIPAGATEPAERLRVTLRDVVGRATIRFRAGAQEVAVPVESVVAQWTAPARVDVAAGARTSVHLSLAPPTRAAPEFRVTSDASAAQASVRPADGGPYPEKFLLDVTGAVAGECTIRVEAPFRPVLTVRVRVAPGGGDAK